MKTHRLYFHLGPVQGFIAEARRTRDIWAGSFLLSWLTAKAMVAALCVTKGDETDIEPDIRRDPTFRAVYDRMLSPGAPAPEPCLGTLTNHFSIAVDQAQGSAAGNAASQAIHDAWIKLATEVAREFFEVAEAQALARRLGVDIQGAHDIWKAQIGDAITGIPARSPLWEISWVVAPNGESHWLDARKNLRWFGGAPTLPKQGNFCSMMTGWAEISAHTKHRQRDQQNAFWSFIRQRAVDIRYPGRGLDTDSCLDIRPNEVLCAPALVKRLFTLLPDATIMKTIGWVPFIRADDAFVAAQEAARTDPGLLTTFYEWAMRCIAGDKPREPRPAFAISESPRPDSSRMQRILLWPSTSAIAAAHWIARVNKYASQNDTSKQEVANLVNAIDKLGPHYRYAESSLWLRCHQTETSLSDLAEVDGAMLYEFSVLQLANQPKYKNSARRVCDMLGTLAHQDLDKTVGSKIGRPSPCYALVRADGDGMGRLLAVQPKKAGAALNSFARDLRGGEGNVLGVIAGNCGITLYAGADEMLGLFPIENALEAACAIRKAFHAAFKTHDLSATISIAVTLAHRQVPLRWVVASNRELLEIAKNIGGRNTLGIEIRDAGGRVCDWVSPWELENWKSPIGSLEALVAAATQATSTSHELGANQFLHDLDATLRPFAFASETISYSERLRLSRVATDPTRPELQTTLIGHRLAESGIDASLAEDIARIGWTFGPHRTGRAVTAFHAYQEHWTPAGLRIIRFLTENWRREQSHAMSGTTS